jgi:hypothetical protein
MDNKKDKKGEYAFVGCMFIGAGIGYLIGNFLAGASIGMGVGFLSSQLLIHLFHFCVDSTKDVLTGQ